MYFVDIEERFERTYEMIDEEKEEIEYSYTMRVSLEYEEC